MGGRAGGKAAAVRMNGRTVGSLLDKLSHTYKTKLKMNTENESEIKAFPHQSRETGPLLRKPLCREAVESVVGIRWGSGANPFA